MLLRVICLLLFGVWNVHAAYSQQPTVQKQPVPLQQYSNGFTQFIHNFQPGKLPLVTFDSVANELNGKIPHALAVKYLCGTDKVWPYSDDGHSPAEFEYGELLPYRGKYVIVSYSRTTYWGDEEKDYAYTLASFTQDGKMVDKLIISGGAGYWDMNARIDTDFNIHTLKIVYGKVNEAILTDTVLCTTTHSTYKISEGKFIRTDEKMAKEWYYLDNTTPNLILRKVDKQK